MRRLAPALALAFAVATAGCSSRGRDAAGADPALDGAASPAAAVPSAPAAVPVYDDLEPAASDDRADGGGTVKIKLLADARRQAHVLWGRKDLGVAPLELVRPRGSAPMDLTIQAADCLPLHVRVFTDRDDTLSLRLYTERDASGLPGYSPTTSTTSTTSTTTKGAISTTKTRHQP
jgi:hypothetical protein